MLAKIQSGVKGRVINLKQEVQHASCSLWSDCFLTTVSNINEVLLHLITFICHVCIWIWKQNFFLWRRWQRRVFFL